MSGSWEDIANEVVPDGTASSGLATGARRGASLPSSVDEWASGDGFLSRPKTPRVVPCPQIGSQAKLDEVLNGQVQSVVGHGDYYQIEIAPLDWDAEYASLASRLKAVLAAEKFPRLSGVQLPELLFMDIETTGLSSSGPLFLIGCLWFERGVETPHLELFLARDYDEEGAVLAAFHRRARGKTLITFNGHAFDWPFIEGRSSRLGLQFSQPRGHMDLLFASRRTWRSKLPNCRLQTLESFICGRAREGDVPSSRIPATYERWLEGHGAHLLAPVAHHNALDVLTMAELLCFLGEGQTWRDRWSDQSTLGADS